MNSHAPVISPLTPLPGSDTGNSTRSADRTEAILAAFTSPDTDRLGRSLGFPIAVVAVTDDVPRHARRLSETWHACWTATDDWFMPFDFGDSTARSTKFRHLPFDERWMGARPLPDGMRLSEGGLLVRLGPGVAWADLGQAFGQAMVDQRFDRVAQRPSEVRRRFASGRRLHVPARYAAKISDGCDGRATLVEDLYAFHPRRFPSIVGAMLSSLRILTMCSALAGAAAASGERHA